MRRFGTVIMAATTLGVAALANAQTSPGPAEPQSSSDRPSASSQQAMPSERTVDQGTHVAMPVPSARSATCMGFDSVSDCVASLHAAQNLGIPFASLKEKVTSGRKLSAAIHDLKPGVDAASEARRAEEQAQADMRSPHG